MTQSISADWIIPVSGDPIKGGAVVTESGSISFVGSLRQAVSLYPDVEEVSYPGKTILPGLINAHCHLDQSFLEKVPGLELSDNDTFFDWICRVVALQAGASEEEKIEAAAKWVVRMKNEGVVAVGDITNDSFTVRLLEEGGLEGVFFHELVGFDPQEAESVYKEKATFLDRLKADSGPIHFLSPHSPYSVSLYLLKRIAMERARVSFHLAESVDEEEFLKGGHPKMERLLKSLGKWDPDWQPPGVSPVRYFYEIGLLHPEAVAVHMVRVDKEDYPLLKETRPNICLCLGSNIRLGNGLPPVIDYVAMGINLCIGTDGLGSNEELSVLNEMISLKREFPMLKDREIVGMGTLGGARALGLADKYGTIEPGKSDKIAVVDSGGDGKNPYSFLYRALPKTHFRYKRA